jgi:hypothetical protein
MSEQSAKSTGRAWDDERLAGAYRALAARPAPLDLIDDTLAATAEKGHRIGRSGRGHAWLTLAGPRAVLAGGAVALGLAAILVASLVFRSTPSAGSGSSSALPSASSTPMTLSIENDTTIAVTLVVNGKVIETVPAGGYQDPIKAELPGLPWNVETRSPSGRLLSSMTVHAGDVWQTTLPNGNGEQHGDAVRVDLSCGRLDVWSGPPLLGPAPGPGQSGDCA